MDLLKWLIGFLRILSPPPPGAEEKLIVKWRNNVSSTLFLLVAAMTFSHLIAFGVVHLFGFTGFALASDLEKQVQIAQSIRVEQLDTKLFDTRGRQCAAMLNKNPSALRSETERLQEKLNQYQAVAGKTYRVPDCSEY